MHRHPGAAEGKEKTVSIETEAILKWKLLVSDKKSTCLFWCRAIFSPSQKITSIYGMFCGNILYFSDVFSYKGFCYYIFVKIIIKIAKRMQLVQDNSQVGNS